MFSEGMINRKDLLITKTFLQIKSKRNPRESLGNAGFLSSVVTKKLADGGFVSF